MVPITKTAKKLICLFIPIVLIAALLTYMIWYLTAGEPGVAVSRALSVLFIGCPLAFSLSLPIAIKFGKEVAKESGLMFNNPEELLDAGRTGIVAMNKIGNITKGEYLVTDVFSADHITKSGYNAGVFAGDDELLETAQLLSAECDHPMAKAVLRHTSELYIEPEIGMDSFKIYPGGGIEGELAGALIRGGSLKFIEEKAIIPSEIRERAMVLSQQGKTPLYFSKGKRLLGIIAVADTLIDNTAQSITEIKNMGIKAVMLTGDNEHTGRAIAAKIGIEDVIPDVTPEKRNEYVDKLSESGKVILIGDDIINGNVIVMKKSLSDVVASIRLSKRILRTAKENLAFSLIFNILGILISSGIFYKAFGLVLSPVFCILAALVSLLLVLLNSLRINLFDIRDSSRDKPAIIK